MGKCAQSGALERISSLQKAGKNQLQKIGIPDVLVGVSINVIVSACASKNLDTKSLKLKLLGCRKKDRGRETPAIRMANRNVGSPNVFLPTAQLSG